MASLANGSVNVTPDRLEVMGNTGNKDANTTVASLLADKLGEGADYSIDITYQEKLDPIAGLPTPEECEAEIREILSSRAAPRSTRPLWARWMISPRC